MSPICSGPLSERKEIEVLEESLREQAAEIAALRGEIESAYVQREADAEIARSEIAALRQFVRWHFMHHPQSWPGFAEIMPAVRRALEEEP